MNNQISIPSVQSSDRNINQLQSNILTGFNQLQSNFNNAPLGSGQIVTGALVAGKPSVIPQTLGRQPVGWFIVDITFASTVFRTAWDVNSITLQGSVSGNVSLYVF
jgi:hypothetical protein